MVQFRPVITLRNYWTEAARFHLIICNYTFSQAKILVPVPEKTAASGRLPKLHCWKNGSTGKSTMTLFYCQSGLSFNYIATLVWKNCIGYFISLKNSIPRQTETLKRMSRQGHRPHWFIALSFFPFFFYEQLMNGPHLEFMRRLQFLCRRW